MVNASNRGCHTTAPKYIGKFAFDEAQAESICGPAHGAQAYELPGGTRDAQFRRRLRGSCPGAPLVDSCPSFFRSRDDIFIVFFPCLIVGGSRFSMIRNSALGCLFSVRMFTQFALLTRARVFLRETPVKYACFCPRRDESVQWILGKCF